MAYAKIRSAISSKTKNHQAPREGLGGFLIYKKILEPQQQNP